MHDPEMRRHRVRVELLLAPSAADRHPAGPIAVLADLDWVARAVLADHADPPAAAGALSAVAAVQAMHEGFIPPTINLEMPDPDCDLDYVPNEPRPTEVNVAMINGFGFGGQNACVVLKKWNGA